MALINCKKPDCPLMVDTGLACTEVNALFGLKLMLHQAIDAGQPGSLLPDHQLQKQMDFVERKISSFKIESPEQQFSLFKKRLDQASNPPKPTIQVLHIQCANGHTFPYEVNCGS